MNRFNSIEEVKAACEFFPKGRIIPQRILHVDKRKYSSRKKFGSNTWAMPTPKGYLLLSDTGKTGYAVLVKNMKNVHLVGSIYTDGGESTYICNATLETDEEWLKSFNNAYAKAFKE